MDKNEEKLAILVKKLGNSATEIADNLHKMGCLGKILADEDDPLASYLKMHGYLFPSVFLSYIVTFPPEDEGDELIEVENTEEVTKFIENFDNEKYPNLISEEK